MVTDRSITPPALTTASPDAESGRGLQVVQALAANWGWTILSSYGKAVWAAFHFPGTATPTTPPATTGLVLLPDMTPL